MLNKTQTIVESTIKNYKDEKSIMNPRLMDLRDHIRKEFEERFLTSRNKHLPFIEEIGGVKNIDKETVINLDSNLSISDRGLLMNEIVNHSNSEGNLTLLINNSSVQVKEYIHILLNNYYKKGILEENSLEMVGNITLYHISNTVLTEIGVNQIMESYRDVMCILKEDQIIPQIREDIIVDYKLVLDKQNLLTDTQLNQTVDNFYQEVDQREEQRLIQSRKRILMVGGGILATMALTSMGAPSYIAGLVGRNALSSVLDSSFISDYRNSSPSTDSIRLRDVFDKFLSITYKSLDKFK